MYLSKCCFVLGFPVQSTGIHKAKKEAVRKEFDVQGFNYENLGTVEFVAAHGIVALRDTTVRGTAFWEGCYLWDLESLTACESRFNSRTRDVR